MRAEQAEAKLAALAQVKAWRNEDGREFVFVSDLLDVLQSPPHPERDREQ
ncbi:hypothetical protein [Actinomadura sp. KC06]|nr:hypothetical protein [Actinomadura sp. KC06]